ncbi:GNAT family N-acetyltransferase [Antrihabitans sp. YC3-6]|uniref:GNAT family N-acetyltransferase n=1 Tax=Antrihabitans stalagmiti TaxID=2799499 RepID=A0A934NU72_9NOCA|nr:GNAT family N-acetyltransferase [Antrihabitans stalagmiti]MBJ8341287.1 GNAT family N-acetyltransferase [Antrihabitans stalagmiti]
MTTTEARLLDGTRVEMRELGPGDSTAILDLYASLDQYDSYLRFFAPPPKKLGPVATSVARSDDEHFGIGAYVDNRLVGVANFVVREDLTTADIAIVVEHKEQMLGVGTSLLRRLQQEASRRHISRFVADVLVENARMLRVIQDLGWRCKRTRAYGVVHLEIDIDGGFENE